MVGFAKANPSWITRGDIKGCTALHYAADANSASALLESLSPDLQRTLLTTPDRTYKRTALHMAVEFEKPEVAELKIRFSKNLQVFDE